MESDGEWMIVSKFRKAVYEKIQVASGMPIEIVETMLATLEPSDNSSEQVPLKHKEQN